jgi:protein-L-isoaspartate(D-aspartate) O-methyltransferase
MMDRSVSAAALRHRLVQVLEEAGVLETTAIARAFRSVPRELFLPRVAAEKGLEAVYRDEAIPTKFDAAGSAVSSSSQPTVMAAMLSRLELQPGLRVLEVGAGTGYNAALLSTIVGPSGSVTSVDIDAVVARHARGALRSGGYPVRVVTGDGRDGVRTYAPYDRIIVTASSDRLPAAWVEQLREGGLLEVPLRIPSLIETQFNPSENGRGARHGRRDPRRIHTAPRPRRQQHAGSPASASRRERPHASRAAGSAEGNRRTGTRLAQHRSEAAPAPRGAQRWPAAPAPCSREHRITHALPRADATASASGAGDAWLGSRAHQPRRQRSGLRSVSATSRNQSHHGLDDARRPGPGRRASGRRRGVGPPRTPGRR